MASIATVDNPVHAGREYANFDPFGRAFLDDPWRWYETLLRGSPGFMLMEGVPSAYVAKQRHVTTVMRDHKRFSSTKPKGLPGMERVDFFNGQPVMNYSDPPLHTRLRRVINAVFQPKRVLQLGDAMDRIIDDLLSDVKVGSIVDVGELITRKLAVRLMMGEFLGVPPEDQPMLLDFVATLGLLDSVRPGDPKPQAYLDAWEQGVGYCRHQIAKAREAGSDNIIGIIAGANEEGALTDEETMAMIIVLYVGGVGSIPSASATSILNLARNPDVAARVREDPAIASKVLEESLRLDAPVPLVMRFCVEDAEIGDIVIPAGTPVYTMLAAACHDPDIFPDPTWFDIDRPNLKEHLAFGHGMHTCIGNAVTRETVPRLAAAVAQRFPNLHFPDPSRVHFDGRPRSRHLRFVEIGF
jgi:cytochrome P450